MYISPKIDVLLISWTSHKLAVQVIIIITQNNNYYYLNKYYLYEINYYWNKTCIISIIKYKVLIKDGISKAF